MLVLSTEQLTHLRQILSDYFGAEDLQILTDDLGFDFYDICPLNATKPTSILRIAKHFNKLGRINDLLDYVQQQRPLVDIAHLRATQAKLSEREIQDVIDSISQDAREEISTIAHQSETELLQHGVEPSKPTTEAKIYKGLTNEVDELGFVLTVMTEILGQLGATKNSTANRTIHEDVYLANLKTIRDRLGFIHDRSARLFPNISQQVLQILESEKSKFVRIQRRKISDIRRLSINTSQDEQNGTYSVLEAINSQSETPLSNGIRIVSLQKQRNRLAQQQAESILKQKDIRDRLCPHFEAWSDDIFVISNTVIQVMVPLILTNVITGIPLTSVLFAYVAIAISKMGVNYWCNGENPARDNISSQSKERTHKTKSANENTVAIRLPVTHRTNISNPKTYTVHVSEDIGVEHINDKKTILFSKGATLPRTAKTSVYPVNDNQSSVDINVVLGRSKKPSECISLGQFRLAGIPLHNSSSYEIEVIFEASRDGNLKVSAQVLATGISESMSINLLNGQSINRQEQAS